MEKLFFAAQKSDLVTLCLAALNQQLHTATCEWDPRPALSVVAAAKDYPEQNQKGAIITGLNQTLDRDSKIFHAGTSFQDKQIVTDGGRILSAMALGDSFQEAQTKAYTILKAIHWDGMAYRQDIGYQVIS